MITDAEWKSFGSALKACLPGMSEKIRKLPKGELAEVMANWRRILCQFNISDLNDIVYRMSAGELDKPFLDDFPGAVAREARKMAMTRKTMALVPEVNVEGRAYRCHACCDTSWASVVSSKTINQLMAGVSQSDVDYEKQVARCSCNLGQSMPSDFVRNDGRKRKPIASLGGVYVPYTGDKEADVAAIAAAIEEGGQRKLETFNSSL